MKFRYLNIDNFHHLAPLWCMNYMAAARLMDHQLVISHDDDSLRWKRWDSKLEFWIELNPEEIRIAVPLPNDIDTRGRMLFHGWTSPFGGIGAASIPMNDLLNGAPSKNGTYSIYIHYLHHNYKLAYIGLTKQPWSVRTSQHASSARSGSNYIFHRAIRDKKEKSITHAILHSGLSYEEAMSKEEELIREYTLYLLGLNMIPGGFAGLRYLQELGCSASAEHRDDAINSICDRQSLNGRPNPLCASRWASDQEFVNSIICGHSGRLTVQQVKLGRLMASIGHDIQKITESVGARNVSQVQRLIRGSTYSRVF